MSSSPARLAYGPGASQFAELSLPPGHDRCGVVVVVHGGFWRAGYDLDLGRPLAADLVGAGVAVWNVEYRRVGGGVLHRQAGGGGWPTTCADVAAAVDALAGAGQDAAWGRLDLDRVVALGHSAGGHLAGWLAARSGVPSGAPGADPVVRVGGVVSQAGVLDLVDAARLGLGGGATQALMGGEPGDLPDAYALASPIARVPLGVPVVCVHGTADLTVPISQSERFVAAATRAGDTAMLHPFDGDHRDLIDVGSEAWRTCRAETLRLLG
ncbi:MAG: alpha/beta hydrolase family protein [Propionibacteriaceae bacterium]